MTVDLRSLIDTPRRSAAAEALVHALTTPSKRMLPDDDVRLILELHAYHGLGYRKLAAKFEVSVSCIQRICKGKRRTRPQVIQRYPPLTKPVI